MQESGQLLPSPGGEKKPMEVRKEGPEKSHLKRLMVIGRAWDLSNTDNYSWERRGVECVLAVSYKRASVEDLVAINRH